MRQSLLFLILNFFVWSIGAQNTPIRDFDVEALADEIFPLQDQNLNYEELYETLLQRLASPLDLNQATAEELRSLFVLRENQIQELLAYREQSPLISEYELQALSTFDPATIQRLLPLIRITTSTQEGTLLNRILHEKNNYLLLRSERTLEQKRGFAENDSSLKYKGWPDRMYARFRVSSANDFSLGITAKQDAGEPFVWKANQRGFDFYSFHFQLQKKKWLRNLVIGDYQCQFGQGLVLGGGFGIGKGSEPVTTLKRSNLGFIPYTSLTESGFFRGAAIHLTPVKRLNLYLFGSRMLRDATLQSDSLDGTAFSAFTVSGLHRTLREIEARKTIEEINSGFSLEWSGARTQFGALLHHLSFDQPLEKRDNLYNQFAFEGKQLSNFSGYVQSSYQNFVLFGEAAHSLQNGWGLAGGLIGSVSRDVDISLHVRKYDANYYSFYSNALSENSTAQNESGMYWGLRYQPTKKLQMAGYIDLFRFDWLRYRSYAPSDGGEWLVKYLYKPNKTTQLVVQARSETKARNLGTDSKTYQVVPGTKTNLMMSLDYAVRPFTFKTRIQGSQFRTTGTTQGVSFVQDVTYSFGKGSLTGRYALFNTDDFDNRQYSNEKDVWLAYSLANYSGTGIRCLVLVRYRITAKIDVWLRWAKTQYLYVDEIGSGTEAIAGNSKNDVKFQTRIRF